MAYYIGKYKDDAKHHRGWIVGTFMDSDARKTDTVEVKYWEYAPGKPLHDTKTSAIYECTLIISGKATAMINGEYFEIAAGDYICIEPDTPNNLIIGVHEPITGITIKAPSNPAAKHVVNLKENNQGNEQRRP